MSEFRDPRFDNRCRGVKQTRNYAFLDSVRKEELQTLQTALRKERDPDRKADIKNTIDRLKSRLAEKKNKEDRDQFRQSHKQKNKNLGKGDLKKMMLVEKFKDLKSSGKLSKYLERKRKKLIKKDGRKAFQDQEE